MDSKNCLAVLSSGFPGILEWARKIEGFFSRDRSHRETALLSRQVRNYYKTVLTPRFKAEKIVQAFLEKRMGREDPGLQSFEENRSTLKKLARSGDPDGLYHFGQKLKGYVYFEMDDLFPRIEKRLAENERAELAAKLVRHLPRQRNAA